MVIFKENKELITEENGDREYMNEFKQGLNELTEKFLGWFIKIDTEYVKIENIEVSNFTIGVRGTAIEFYEVYNDFDKRSEIEINQDSWRYLMDFKLNATSLNDIEDKIKKHLVSKYEMEQIFNENFDSFKENFHNKLFGC